MTLSKALESGNVDKHATEVTRARYQRLSRIYDVMQGRSEKRFRPWREKLWEMVRGPRVLEVGVGTGKNMAFWPHDAQMTAIDLTPGMLDIARQRAQTLGVSADISLGDVQALNYPDGSFDTIVGTFLFCSVPDPVLGLRELSRVVRPGGQVLLLEHVRSENQILGALMDVVNPLVVRMMGANINRRTVNNVRLSGLDVTQVVDLAGFRIFKLIVAQPGK
jgi:ubiquinone/menaquinone biosynthesis C-methylase UbiE